MLNILLALAHLGFECGSGTCPDDVLTSLNDVEKFELLMITYRYSFTVKSSMSESEIFLGYRSLPSIPGYKIVGGC
jgi:hypothetical protein